MLSAAFCLGCCQRCQLPLDLRSHPGVGINNLFILKYDALPDWYFGHRLFLPAFRDFLLEQEIGFEKLHYQLEGRIDQFRVLLSYRRPYLAFCIDPGFIAVVMQLGRFENIFSLILNGHLFTDDLFGRDIVNPLGELIPENALQDRLKIRNQFI